MTRRHWLRAGMATLSWKMLSPLYPGACTPASPGKQAAESNCGLDYYSQGGVVVDGVAYFTADDQSKRPGFRGKESPDFPHVVAFGVDDYKIIRRYPVAKTYDSTPLVIQKGDGTWLVLAHEYQKARTLALARDTGKVQWMSVANQPGGYFFGYSYFQCADGSKLILMACSNGLHAMSSETGRDVWWVKQDASGGITPCVDQANGWVFYQCTGKVLKIRADDGKVLKWANVTHPAWVVSWNTVLVNDSCGYFVATRWYGNPEWDSAIRVFDKDLDLVWEKTKLPSGKKDTLTYSDGKLITGSGNTWSKRYTGHDWKYIAAFAIADGRVIWKCDLANYEYNNILNIPYYNGFFYAETQDSPPNKSKVFRIHASDGRLAEVLEYGRPITSCAQCIIAHGRILSGDLWEDRIVVSKIAENSKADWPGPFCDPQSNPMALPEEPGAKCVPMQELFAPLTRRLEQELLRGTKRNGSRT
ncbi:MAG: hypothetical protein ABSF45_29850 [Terriglobia bacterium]